jgi:hypothetical protein
VGHAVVEHQTLAHGSQDLHTTARRKAK